MNMFRGKTIGLIWDKHTSHYSDEVMEFAERCIMQIKPQQQAGRILGLNFMSFLVEPFR
jgi:hypothetical protein